MADQGSFSLPLGTSRRKLIEKTTTRLEEGIVEGTHVVGKLRNKWMGTPYFYGVVDSVEPLTCTCSHGYCHDSTAIAWLVKAQDDGWLAPFGNEWQTPGRTIIFQLLNKEWITAKVADGNVPQPVKQGFVNIKIDGIEDMTSICVQKEVAFIFVPHEDCQEEFGHSKPFRGGWLCEHICDSFQLASHMRENNESRDEAVKNQRRRWVTVSRSDGQYPLRAVWVHPQIKEGALNEFARRARAKHNEAPEEIKPEVVMLVGPPAAGKSSISRLKREQLCGPLQEVRGTAYSLQYREEVNNDNLTDCMPGFPEEYKRVMTINDSQIEEAELTTRGKALWQRAKMGLRKKSVEKGARGNLARVWHHVVAIRKEQLESVAWALRWLTYLVYHHGPVRDSLALDLIKVTIIDAHELPVYYSSCMAGKAMGRAMMILDLSHSATQPVPHRPLPFRGFWPFTSQEARFDRQAGRASEEKKERKLKGGNLTSNLVDMHFHAQQAESNITKMLGSLYRGERPADESDEEGETTIKADHFLVIDNEGKEPQVLIDFADDDAHVDGGIQLQLHAVVKDMLQRRPILENPWDDMDPHLFTLIYYILKISPDRESDPLFKAAQKRKRDEKIKGMPHDPAEVLPLCVAIDEAVFFAKYGQATTATGTDEFRGEWKISSEAKVALQAYSKDEIDALKKDMSVIRKYVCLAVMQSIKDDEPWVDCLIEQEKSMANMAHHTSSEED